MDATTLTNLGLDITAANQGQLRLVIAGLNAKDVTFVNMRSSEHAISQDYCFDINLQLGSAVDLARYVGAPAYLEILDNTAPVFIHGVISAMSFMGHRPDGEAYFVQMRSMLYPLKHNFQNRVFLNKDAKQIVEDILLTAKFNTAEFEFKTQGSYPVREFTVQYAESDYDFLSRILAYEGMFFVLEQSDRGAKIVIYDSVGELPAFEAGELMYEGNSGTTRAAQTVFALNRQSQMLTDRVQLKDYNYRTPEANLETAANRAVGITGAGKAYIYGENFKTLDEGSRIAKVRQQSLDWQREVYVADTDCRGLRPGMSFTLNNHPNSALNGDYVVLQIDHVGDQAAGHARGPRPGSVTYRNKVTVIKAGVPYRTTLPALRLVHGVFTCKVETTGGEYAYLDEQGRYHLRMPFDLSSTQDGEATHPVRQAQPYSGRDFGLHCPLHAGTEVIVTCLNGDIDRPIMLGAVHNPELPNLVTSANNSQNILRSWGDNELLMEDRQGEERIDLFTRLKKNILTLDAKEGQHHVYLGTEEGEMEQYAAKTMYIESGDTMTIQSGNDHLLTVENAHSLMTNNKEIEFKAKTDIRHKAANNVFLKSETQNVEMKVGKDMVVDVQNNMSLEVRNKDLNIVCKGGNFEIKAAKAITVKGQGGGNITVSQAGGSVVIDTGGAIKIAGTTVNIDGDAVYLKGATVKQGGGGSGSGASGSQGGTTVKNLRLAAVDLFTHLAQQAQDVAATINATKASAAQKAEDLTVDQLQTSASSNASMKNSLAAALPAANADEQHHVAFDYKDQNGNGLNDIDFEVTFDGGSKRTGTLQNGFQRLDGVPNEGFTVEFVPKAPLEAELKELRSQLRRELDASLQQVRAETAMLSKTWEDTAMWQKPFIYVGGAMTGIGQWVGDSVEGVVDVATGISKAQNVTAAWLAEYSSHRSKAFSAFASGDDATFEKEMQAIEAMHSQLGEDINDVAQSVRTLGLIALDSETRKMLQEFPASYFSELHSTEKVRTGFRYGVDIILVLAAGAGAGLLAIKNAGRISGILSKMAKVLEKLRFNLRARKGKVDETYTFKANEKKFTTHGLKTDPLDLPEGRALMKDIKAANPSASNDQIYRWAKTMLASGEDVPKISKASKDTQLYKIVPKDQEVSGHSAYFFDTKELKYLRENPKEIDNRLALPKASEAKQYDIYMIEPIGGKEPNIFISKIAPTSEAGINKSGGGMQSIVPNRTEWTQPTLVGSI